MLSALCGRHDEIVVGADLRRKCLLGFNMFEMGSCYSELGRRLMCANMKGGVQGSYRQKEVFAYLSTIAWNDAW